MTPLKLYSKYIGVCFVILFGLLSIQRFWHLFTGVFGHEPLVAILMDTLLGSDFLDNELTNTQAIKLAAHKWHMLWHTISGGLLIILGVFLLSDTFRIRRTRLHRKMGWVYATICLLSMLSSGMYLVSIGYKEAFSSAVFGMGLWSLFVITVSTLLLAIYFAYKKDHNRHGFFMGISYFAVISAPHQRIEWILLGLFFPEIQLEQANQIYVGYGLAILIFLAALYFLVFKSKNIFTQHPTPVVEKTMDVIQKIALPSILITGALALWLVMTTVLHGELYFLPIMMVFVALAFFPFRRINSIQTDKRIRIQSIGVILFYSAALIIMALRNVYDNAEVLSQTFTVNCIVTVNAVKQLILVWGAFVLLLFSKRSWWVAQLLFILVFAMIPLNITLIGGGQIYLVLAPTVLTQTLVDRTNFLFVTPTAVAMLLFLGITFFGIRNKQ